MPVVLVVQVPVHDVAGVVPVGDRRVPAPRPVNVVRRVGRAGVPAEAPARVRRRHREDVLLDRPVGRDVVQVPVVDVVHVVAVLDRNVPAPGAVPVVVVGVQCAVHSSSSRSGLEPEPFNSSAWATAFEINPRTCASASE